MEKTVKCNHANAYFGQNCLRCRIMKEYMEEIQFIVFVLVFVPVAEVLIYVGKIASWLRKEKA